MGSLGSNVIKTVSWKFPIGYQIGYHGVPRFLMERLRKTPWHIESHCGRYRIAKTMGSRCRGCPSGAAYSAWMAGPSSNTYAKTGWTLLGYYDSTDQAKHIIEEHSNDRTTTNDRQQHHPDPA